MNAREAEYLKLILQLADCAVGAGMFPDDDFYYEDNWRCALTYWQNKLFQVNKLRGEERVRRVKGTGGLTTRKNGLVQGTLRVNGKVQTFYGKTNKEALDKMAAYKAAREITV